MKSTTNIENIVLDTLVHLHMDGYDSYACARTILPTLEKTGYQESDIFAAIQNLSSKNLINIESVSQTPASKFKCVNLIPFTKQGFAYWKKYC